MDLSHNIAFRILDGQDAGIYRVVLEEVQIGKIAVVRLDPPAETRKSKGGRKRLEKTKRPRKKAAPPMLGEILWMDRSDLVSLKDDVEITAIEIEQDNYTLSEADAEVYEFRKKTMAPFLEFDHFREMILIHEGISGLVNEVADQGWSDSYVRKNFSLLCRYGFDETSLRPTRSLRCGAPGEPRPCDPGGRKKPGRKTNKQRIAKEAHGIFLEPEQPGSSSLWRSAIIAADKRIPSPKPDMPERVQMIVDSAFVKRFRQENGEMVAIDPKLGEYPNARQIQRVLEKSIPKLQRLLERTTKGHFKRSLRGLIARSWKGVVGPGHTWAIDSSIADVYLRSSVNRAWIIGRPIVYIIVDVWSTAIVGFYVCLDGPSWDMAKVALFSAVANPQLLGSLWDYEITPSLFPAPSMCAMLLCDRGEYLSQAAKVTGAKLIPNLAYTPPYRPDLKGLVEVLHRIEKDRQFYFIPGAIDQRREEYELRRFDPSESVMTIPEYVAFLHETFTTYNLTAPRDDRLDVFMRAAGVFPSPSGLWRYGHEVGVGVRRHLSETKLITELLPSEMASVTRRGVKFLGMEYSSPEIEEREWTARARNFGAWDIQSHYFPGSVSRLWTPDPAAAGLLELQLSDHSVASPELTTQEFLDAFMVGKINSQENAHIKLTMALESRRKVEAMIQRAQELTAEALRKYSGTTPSMSEARAFENAKFTTSNATSEAQDASEDSIRAAYQEMMGSVFGAINV
jgi:hypothetical protein